MATDDERRRVAPALRFAAFETTGSLLIPSCSECGPNYLCMPDASYCPDCGARVVVE